MTKQSMLQPPICVRGMTKLVRESFDRKFIVRSIALNAKDINKVLPKIKKYILKLQNFNPVQDQVDNSSIKLIVLHPDLVPSVNSLEEILEKLNIPDEVELIETEINITYDNWDKDQLMAAILPEDLKGASSFSLVGHILQLNLKEFMKPYKFIIAQILLDKLTNVTMVVNKINTIDNSDSDFRSFAMETLAGEGEMIATVKENGCNFKLDFSEVYWNSRLGMEHQRVCDKLERDDVLFDVMAGVGPFSIPVAKKNCKVFANDLNPISVKYLKENANANKVEKRVNISNMDGHLFIKTVFRTEYLKFIRANVSNDIHITMNLPSISLNFISSFIDLFEDDDNIRSNFDDCSLPILHVYFFSKTDCKASAFHSVAASFHPLNNMSDELLRPYLIETLFVRRVSPTKVMMRVSVRIPSNILYNKTMPEPLPKKVKLDT